jgi:hypothetical protein
MVNARETMNLPGHKSDIQESQWLTKLHTYGCYGTRFGRRKKFAGSDLNWRQRNGLVHTAE